MTANSAGATATPPSPATSWSVTPGDAQEATWRIDLDSSSAETTLRTLTADVAAASTALAAADTRLATYCQATAHVAIHLAAQAQGVQPEATLAFLSSTLQSATWETVTGQFQAFLNQMKAAAALQSTIVTTINRTPIATTVLSANGSLRTAWAASLTEDQQKMHVQMVDVALRSRALLLRKLALVVRGAALLSSSTALGPLALPAVVRFIEDVQRQVQEV